MFFSVIITTYNRAEKLQEVLEAYFAQSVSQQDFEIIVADDGSTDNTKSVIAVFRKKFEHFQHFSQKNQGQGVARNNSIKRAKGEIVVFGQDDIVPTPDFLYEHQKFHYLHPEKNAAVLGFTAWHPNLQINPFMKWVTNGSSFLGRFGGHQFAYEKLQGKTMADYNFFYTSNISLKKSLLAKYPFDTEFGGYGWEDIELGYRLQKQENLKIYYNSWAVAYHNHLMQEQDLKPRMHSIGKSAWIIHKKHPELKKIPSFFKYALLRFFTTLPFIIFFKVLNGVFAHRFDAIYFYLLSKKYFIEGVKIGRAL